MICSQNGNEDGSICNECLDTYNLLNNDCLSECPTAGYFAENKLCKECAVKCKECSSEVICLICKEDWYLYNQECIT